MRYSKGICWINDCRIPFVDEGDVPTGGFGLATIGYGNDYEYSGGAGKSDKQGRFTPNLLVCDDVLNDGVITKADKGKSNDYDKNWIHYGGNLKQKRNAGFGDKGTNSRYYDLDLWFNHLINKL